MFSSVVLARLFLVVPFEKLPDDEKGFAAAQLKNPAELSASTRVLSLLGTAGREPDWNERAKSRSHLAVPLVSSASVERIPMLARLLGDSEIDFAALDDGQSVATRRMLGGANSKFYVPDASTARNLRGEHVIADRDFVAKYAVRSVFGMGGAHADGTLVSVVVFTDEQLSPLVVDRFPGLIGSFKAATTPQFAAGRLY